MSAFGETSGLRLQLLDQFKGTVMAFAEVDNQTLDIFVKPDLADEKTKELDAAIQERAPDLRYVIKQHAPAAR